MPSSALLSTSLIVLLSFMAVHALRTKPGLMSGPPTMAILRDALAVDASAVMAYVQPRITLPALLPLIAMGVPELKETPQMSHSYFLHMSQMHTGRPVGPTAPPLAPPPIILLLSPAATTSLASCRRRTAPGLAAAASSSHRPMTSQTRLPNVPLSLISGWPCGQRWQSYAANVPSVGSQLDAPWCPTCPPRGRFPRPPSLPDAMSTTSPLSS